MTKEQAFKEIESRIDSLQELMTECSEILYNAGYNQAIEDAVFVQPTPHINAMKIRSLKK